MTFISNRPYLTGAGIYTTVCCIATITVAISTSISNHQDDDYSDTNFTIFTYHLPDDEDINNTADWFFGFTDMPPDGDLSYNSYDIIGEMEKTKAVAAGKSTGQENNQVDDQGDIVELFLAQVNDQNKAKCAPGTEHNLGSGVIKQYGLNRFKAQALVAVNRANLLTRIWKEAEKEILQSEYLFYTLVRSIVEGDPEIFAAGNCYDKNEFKDYHLFCAYSYRMEDGRINVKDLSLEYDYLKNTSDWFYSARQKAKDLKRFNVTKGKSIKKLIRSFYKCARYYVTKGKSTKKLIRSFY